MYRHIQILGYPRTGTSLLQSLLYTSLHGFSVPAEERTVATYLKYPYDTVGKRVLDMANYELMMQFKAESDKQISYILMMRDIRDVITSKHPSVPDDYFIGYDHQYYVFGPNKASYTNPGIIDQLKDYRKFKKDPSVIKIKYDELVSNPDKVQDTLKDKLDVRFTGDFSNAWQLQSSRFFAYMANSSKIFATSVGKWKNHKKRIIDQFTKCETLFDILMEDGYEKNKTWFKNL